MPASRTTPAGYGILVIHVALFRMASLSLAEAYRILGYKVHHGTDNIIGNPWKTIEKAAEATWPSVLPEGASPRPMLTREDWDEAWGNEYKVVTELAAPFAEQLIKTYPDAKIVVVQRDFDSWWPSFTSQCLDTLFSPFGTFATFVAGNIMGIRSGYAMRKVYFGFFGATNREEIEVNGRKGYDAYFERIRALVPAERRLEYTIGDGWEPLCAFLGKEVPDVPFPYLNTRKAHGEMLSSQHNVVFAKAALKLALWTVIPVVVGVGVWYLLSQSQRAA